ncbi:hypothetical protein ACP70R_050088 [Stipagrostis hirtigluma subsp. patula]
MRKPSIEPKRVEAAPASGYDDCTRGCYSWQTAVVPLGDGELHLVAMTSRRNLTHHACFWGYKLPFGLYNSCLTMLNLRCLGIVFDLDETLIVANTSRSSERVPPLSDNHQPLTRPVIRLQERNIILTRINPLIRDTSVLVQLRPAWEDLRSYLIAKGRKRFEVYVCTMAERDYALEMWRLLDPDSRLINSIQLQDRMVCVKSGLKKSLLNVFHDGSCHPGMALVIDDRLKVWDEKDQSRVHVVPAFTPYYAPQAEANCSVPVLCVARNVACIVRGCFFKDFDEGLLPRIGNVLYEDDINDIPSAPDVGNYLTTEDESVAVANGNRDSVPFDGMADAEVERRMKEASANAQAIHPTVANFVMPVVPAQNFVSSSVAPLAPPLGMMPPPFSQPAAQPAFSDSLQGSPAREEGEVPESELDPDTRRRLLILQHGQDTRDPTPPLPVIPPVQVPVPPVQPHGNWFPAEDGMNPDNLNKGSAGCPLELDTMLYEKTQPPHPSFFHGGDNPVSSDRFSYQNQSFPSQLPHAEDQRMLQNHAPPKYRFFSVVASRHVPSSQRNIQIEPGRRFAQSPGTSAGILEEIALKCGSKVEYRSILCDTAELQFSIEITIGNRIAYNDILSHHNSLRLTNNGTPHWAKVIPLGTTLDPLSQINVPFDCKVEPSFVGENTKNVLLVSAYVKLCCKESTKWTKDLSSLYKWVLLSGPAGIRNGSWLEPFGITLIRNGLWLESSRMTLIHHGSRTIADIVEYPSHPIRHGSKTVADKGFRAVVDECFCSSEPLRHKWCHMHC